ncbi:flagellar hook protein FlgE [Tamilnaduibacter salinus]|uniref:Flagellar hook protein FlgE n=1 Tax=Tamilnaduibacter salinus TaxID=1484056 RepID=A0A2A2I2H2_9GAMM|nr:flagellar hook protein FlgE [Tamilnaduibacter salinus]PAV26221.1 flagellar biosynthesis protein FlgE [Tamilnaduibacter salinus]PVY75292.1 flagellar hook protein FlgE [Tamilnaduibacter salinus]
MAFNIGLSGLRASQVDLDVTGNNISNASTVGFKGSEAQFGDLYASGFLSSGSNPIGDGVRVQDVQQQFGQGNIRFTDNGLDMAINGDGFFVLNNDGEVRYSRAGQFGIDKDGFVTNNQNMRVQGFQADDDGNLSGVRGDLQVDSDNLAPQRTTNVDSDLNLDSRESVLAESGSRYETDQPALNAQTNAQELTVTYPDSTTRTVDIAAGASARSIANSLSQEEDVSATGRTESVLDGTNDGNILPGDILTLQNVDFTVQATDDNGNALTQQEQLQQLADDINGSSLSSLNATINGAGDLRIISSRGDTLGFSYDNSGGGGSLEFDSGTAVSGDPNNPSEQVGGVNITLGRDITLAATPDTAGDDTILTGESPDGFVTNTFDPTDQRTYNHATSSTIYDSLGNPHTMTQYFVKEPATGVNQGSPWSLYVQIDGRNVGDPVTPGGQPTMAQYDLLFNENGTLESVDGDPENEILVSNWVPVDENGQPNGADGPRTVADGGQIPIPEPPVSSNFSIDLRDTTQYGSEFAVNDQQQNGFTTGRLSGLDVSNEGVLFARYSNGQSLTLGQVALAGFNNTEGLSPVGETTWVETFESGQPIVGAPDSGTLGSIKSSSVEESNVDLSGELVNLIIAQRNYQANAKTIETADSVTQTIINLR